MGRSFTAILAAEWLGVLDRSWNSERPLVFVHIVLTKMLGVRRAREIRSRITRRVDTWERGLHVNLVGNAEAEGVAQEVRAAFSGKEEDKAVARRYHDTVLSGKLRQAVCRAINSEGGGCLLPDGQCTKPGDRLHRSSERSTQICVSPLWKTPRAQPSRSTRKYPKRYPSTSRRMT